MNPRTERVAIDGPAGPIECALDRPAAGVAAQGLAVVCHPHPQHGGTLDNKVVQTLTRAFVQRGWASVRFNFRGVGASGGGWDAGRGEIDDALAVVAAHRAPGQRLVLAGFSFGAYVASHAAARLRGDPPATAGGSTPSVGAAAPAEPKATADAPALEPLVLIGPAVVNFPLAPVPADALVVHGQVDEVVPIDAVFAWAGTQRLPVVVVPGSGHFFHGQLPLLRQIVTRAWHPHPDPDNASETA